jgi:hypothetical protein
MPTGVGQNVWGHVGGSTHLPAKCGPPIPISKLVALDPAVVAVVLDGPAMVPVPKVVLNRLGRANASGHPPPIGSARCSWIGAIGDHGASRTMGCASLGESRGTP